ncbi:MAG: hypothetical protein WKG07_06365 [Hymenobacter sp.]
MKKSHIFMLVVIAAAVGIIISTMSDASSYSTFTIARQQAAAGNESKVHVVGTLPRGADKRPVGLEYDPVENPNYFCLHAGRYATRSPARGVPQPSAAGYGQVGAGRNRGRDEKRRL